MKARILAFALVTAAVCSPSWSQADSLASDLPADTLIYFEIPDVQAMIRDSRGSALGRMYRDGDVQNFMEPVHGMVAEGWTQVRAMGKQYGLPAELMEWEALQSVEFGFCLSGGTGGEPSLCAGLSVGLKGDLASKVFHWLANMASSEGRGEVIEGATGPVLRIPYKGGENMEVRLIGSRLVGWAQHGQFDGPRLANSTLYQEAKRGTMFDGAAMFGMINPAAGINTLVETLKAQEEWEGASIMQGLFKGMGMESLGTISFASGWQGGDSHSVAAVEFVGDGPEGIFAAGMDLSVDYSLLDYVPENATSFSLASLDMGATWAEVEKLIGEISEIEVRPGRTIEGEWKESGHPTWDWMRGEKSQLIRSGMNGFGHSAFSYSVTSGGMMGGPAQGGAFVKVDDPAAVRAMLQGLMPQVKEWIGMVDGLPLDLEIKNVPLRSKNEQGETVTAQGPEDYVIRIKASKLPQEMRQAAFFLANLTPTFGVTEDGWMAMAMSRITVTNALRKGLPKPETSVRRNPEVKSFLDRLPDRVHSMSWSDPRPGLEQAITMVQNFVPMIAMQVPQDKIPVDLNAIPGPKSFVSYMRPTETFTYSAGNRMITDSTGSFDLADLMVMCGAGLTVAPLFMLMAGVDMEHAMPAEESGVSVEEKSGGAGTRGPGGASEVGASSAQKQKVRAELTRLRAGIVVYQIENGSYPQSLVVLTKPADTYPSGYLPDPARGLGPDPWGNDFVYKVAGGRYKLYSAGPNGRDDGGSGDDIGLEG